jgi:hypothetical protein
LRHAVMRLRASLWAFTAPRPSSRASSVKDSALPARWWARRWTVSAAGVSGPP